MARSDATGWIAYVAMYFIIALANIQQWTIENKLYAYARSQRMVLSRVHGKNFLPLPDRIDPHIEVPAVKYKELSGGICGAIA